jgi:hypothetical protein
MRRVWTELVARADEAAGPYRMPTTPLANVCSIAASVVRGTFYDNTESAEQEDIACTLNAAVTEGGDTTHKEEENLILLLCDVMQTTYTFTTDRPQWDELIAHIIVCALVVRHPALDQWTPSQPTQTWRDEATKGFQTLMFRSGWWGRFEIAEDLWDRTRVTIGGVPAATRPPGKPDDARIAFHEWVGFNRPLLVVRMLEIMLSDIAAYLNEYPHDEIAARVANHAEALAHIVTNTPRGVRGIDWRAFYLECEHLLYTLPVEHHGKPLQARCMCCDILIFLEEVSPKFPPLDDSKLALARIRKNIQPTASSVLALLS